MSVFDDVIGFDADNELQRLRVTNAQEFGSVLGFLFSMSLTDIVGMLVDRFKVSAPLAGAIATAIQNRRSKTDDTLDGYVGDDAGSLFSPVSATRRRRVSWLESDPTPDTAESLIRNQTCQARSESSASVKQTAKRKLVVKKITKAQLFEFDVVNHVVRFTAAGAVQLGNESALRVFALLNKEVPVDPLVVRAARAVGFGAFKASGALFTTHSVALAVNAAPLEQWRALLNAVASGTCTEAEYERFVALTEGWKGRCNTNHGNVLGRLQKDGQSVMGDALKLYDKLAELKRVELVVGDDGRVRLKCTDDEARDAMTQTAAFTVQRVFDFIAVAKSKSDVAVEGDDADDDDADDEETEPKPKDKKARRAPRGAAWCTPIVTGGRRSASALCGIAIDDVGPFAASEALLADVTHVGGATLPKAPPTLPVFASAAGSGREQERLTGVEANAHIGRGDGAIFLELLASARSPLQTKLGSASTLFAATDGVFGTKALHTIAGKADGTAIDAALRRPTADVGALEAARAKLMRESKSADPRTKQASKVDAAVATTSALNNRAASTSTGAAARDGDEAPHLVPDLPSEFDEGEHLEMLRARRAMLAAAAANVTFSAAVAASEHARQLMKELVVLNVKADGHCSAYVGILLAACTADLNALLNALKVDERRAHDSKLNIAHAFRDFTADTLELAMSGRRGEQDPYVKVMRRMLGNNHNLTKHEIDDIRDKSKNMDAQMAIGAAACIAEVALGADVEFITARVQLDRREEFEAEFGLDGSKRQGRVGDIEKYICLEKNNSTAFQLHDRMTVDETKKTEQEDQAAMARSDLLALHLTKYMDVKDKLVMTALTTTGSAVPAHSFAIVRRAELSELPKKLVQRWVPELPDGVWAPLSAKRDRAKNKHRKLQKK